MRILAQLRVGDYFGEHILLESFSQHSTGCDHQCRETVVAVTEVECIVLSRSSFDVHMGAWLGSMLSELSEIMVGSWVGGTGLMSATRVAGGNVLNLRVEYAFIRSLSSTTLLLSGSWVSVSISFRYVLSPKA
jgi:CRP-like cAMP-binding protein